MSLKACSGFKMHRHLLSLSPNSNYDAIYRAGLIERTILRFDEAIYSVKRDNFGPRLFLQDPGRVVRSQPPVNLSSGALSFARTTSRLHLAQALFHLGHGFVVNAVNQ